MRLQDQAPRRRRLREAEESSRQTVARQLTTASNDARSMAYTAPERKYRSWVGLFFRDLACGSSILRLVGSVNY